MPKDILLKAGKLLKGSDTKGLEYDNEEVFTETDYVGAQAVMDTHESTYQHADLHFHLNKFLVLDYITDPGSGQIITEAERNKVAAMDVVHYGTPLQNTVQLSAILEANCNDKERRYVEDELSDYFYDETAVTGDIAPDDQTGGTGFWRKVAVGGETAASIKTKYESNANTNAFTDAEQTKLGNITDTGSGIIMSTAERTRLNSYMWHEIHTVTATDITNGYFTTSVDVIDTTGMRIDEVNGVALINRDYANIGSIDADYEVFNDNEVHINNNGAATELGNSSIIEGDVLLISYRRNV